MGGVGGWKAAVGCAGEGGAVGRGAGLVQERLLLRPEDRGVADYVPVL